MKVFVRLARAIVSSCRIRFLNLLSVLLQIIFLLRKIMLLIFGGVLIGPLHVTGSVNILHLLLLEFWIRLQLTPSIHVSCRLACTRVLQRILRSISRWGLSDEFRDKCIYICDNASESSANERLYGCHNWLRWLSNEIYLFVHPFLWVLIVSPGVKSTVVWACWQR